VTPHNGAMTQATVKVETARAERVRAQLKRRGYGFEMTPEAGLSDLCVFKVAVGDDEQQLRALRDTVADIAPGATVEASSLD